MWRQCCCLQSAWLFKFDLIFSTFRPQVATRLLAHKIQSPQEKEALQALTVSNQPYSHLRIIHITWCIFLIYFFFNYCVIISLLSCFWNYMFFFVFMFVFDQLSPVLFHPFFGNFVWMLMHFLKLHALNVVSSYRQRNGLFVGEQMSLF